MTITVTDLGEDQDDRDPGATGCLRTSRGNLPLYKLDVRAAISGLASRTDLVQSFRNPYDEPLEATYVFPLPDRGALTAMTMTADGRKITAELHERAVAREKYDAAIEAGHRASIAEEERPDVFTMRVGNIAPGEVVEVSLTVAAPLPYEDGEATYRFPLVVAPRYIPGAPLPGARVGDGYAPDTDATPDASRITPPVLLPGFPNPVALSIEVAIDVGSLPLGDVRSSLHAITAGDGVIRVVPGERVNRDFVLRLPYAEGSSALTVRADADGDEGTFEFTVLPPRASVATRPKDVVVVLDRSGSMGGWKLVAARRAAARIIDTLQPADRLAVLTFDNVVEFSNELPHRLVEATDRHRYRAVEHLSRTDARGGTELLEPLQRAFALLNEEEGARDRVLVLVTDGQVGNEDQILAEIVPLLPGIRVHTVGIDQAVNAGFLARLASVGGGRCELVESEDRLDTALDAIHRRISAPAVTGLRLDRNGAELNSISPQRLPDLFTGVPLVIRGRYRGNAPALALSGTASDDKPWHVAAQPYSTDAPAITQLWARSALRDLEDAYVTAPADALERRIVDTSLRFGVLCRFTAYVAIDSRVTNDGGNVHRVIQPVELPLGWELQHSMPMSGQPFAARALSLGYAVPASAPYTGLSARAGSFRASRQSAKRAASGDDAVLAARAQAADEAKRLERMPESESVRRDALDDLLTRLDALIQSLTSAGLDTSALRAIAKLLRDKSLPTSERWQRAGKALAEFARTEPARRVFWKRDVT